MLKTIVENGIEYHLDDKGTLKRLNNIIGKDMITIPHILHTGDVINALGECFMPNEPFDEIIVSDEITKISTYAFQTCLASTIRWSTGCKRIPSMCFAGSKIRKLTNIENVSRIAGDAFWACKLELEWPSRVKKIPNFCFRGGVVKLTGIDNVTSVEKLAFCCSNIESVVWPSKCKVIPEGCFLNSKLRSISNVGHVVSIGSEAFKGVKLAEPVDFSGVMAIDSDAFKDADKSMITFPYYYSDC